MMRKTLLCSICLLTAVCGRAKNKSLTVTNTTDSDRSRIVEVTDYPEGSFVIRDKSGNEIPYQLTHDGKLIFMATVPARKTVKYFYKPGTPAKTDTICYGRVFPERKDDLAWENDRSAYRAYGPALQASGEKAYGYDVWTKSVDCPILEQRYHNALVNHISFHEDHGDGMDVYDVGPTLGGGTSALLAAGDSIIYPYCWETAEILDNGPLRFSARLVYPPCVVKGDTVVETRLITLDAGDWLNRTEVTYSGLKHPMRPMAGIVVHDSNPEAFATDTNSATYSDLTQQPDADNGEIYVALFSTDPVETRYMPLSRKIGDAIGHVAIVGKPGNRKFTYYWGSGWSKGGIADFDAWNKTVYEIKQSIVNPLIVKVNN